MPLIIVTGQIGAGKSALVSALARLGAQTLSADDVVHALYREDTDLIREISKLAGAEVISASGEVDRAKLATKLFSDHELRADIEALVHPRVRSRLLDFRNRHSGELVVYEVPIWREGANREDADLVVEVQAPLEVRIGRLVSRGLQADDARRRVELQSQTSRGESDLVIQNDQDLESLNLRAAEIIQGLGETSNASRY